MKLIRFLTISVLLLFPILGMAQSNDEKIQGTWRLDTTDGKFMEWTFDKGSFTQKGSPSISQKGKYRIVQEMGVQIKVELYEQEGTQGTENRQIIILIDAKRKELSIDRKSGFKQKVE